MKIISFYSGDKFYYECAETFRNSLSLINADFYLEEINLSIPNWMNITKYKPTFIKNQLLKFKCPVLWIDIDSLIEKVPPEPVDCDICGVKTYLEIPNLLTVKVESYLIYFNYNQQTIKFIEKWEKQCKEVNMLSSDHLFFAYCWESSNKIKKKYFDSYISKEFVKLFRSETEDKQRCIEQILESRK